MAAPFLRESRHISRANNCPRDVADCSIRPYGCQAKMSLRPGERILTGGANRPLIPSATEGPKTRTDLPVPPRHGGAPGAGVAVFLPVPSGPVPPSTIPSWPTIDWIKQLHMDDRANEGGGLEIRSRLSHPVSSYLETCPLVPGTVARRIWAERLVSPCGVQYVAKNVANFLGTFCSWLRYEPALTPAPCPAA